MLGSRRRKGRSWIFALVVAVCLAWLPGLPAPTHAQADAYEESIALAVEEFRVGNFPEARAMFERAHALRPSARTWRGLGLTSFELRRYVQAIGELESALADPRRPLTAAMRQDVEAIIARARAYVATYELRVEPGNARVEIDGQAVEIPEDGKVMLDPGSHHVVVHAAGHAQVEREIVADAGERDALSVSLRLLDGGDGQPQAGAQGSRRLGRRFIVGWTASSLAVAFGAMAAGFGVATHNTSEEYDACTVDCEGLRSTGERQKRLTNASAGVAAGAGLAAVVAFTLEGRRRRDLHQVAVAPLGLRYRLSF